MAHYLKDLVDKKINVITNDGKNYVGVLKGFDQKTNIIVHECVERVFSETEACNPVSVGLYLIRGDNIAVIGELDEELDNALNLSTTRAAPLKPIVH